MSARHYTRRSTGGLELFLDMGPVERATEFLMAFGRKAEKPIIRAMNRTLSGVATDAVNGVRRLYNVKAGAVRKNIEIRKARTHSAGQARRLDGRVGFSGRATPLYDFGPLPKQPRPKKPPRVGVSVKVRKKTGRVKIPGSFIANMPVRGPGVYYRPGKDRNKVLKMYAVSIPQMVDDVGLVDEITDGMAHRFTRNMDHEIDYFLSKQGLR